MTKSRPPCGFDLGQPLGSADFGLTLNLCPWAAEAGNQVVNSRGFLTIPAFGPVVKQDDSNSYNWLSTRHGKRNDGERGVLGMASPTCSWSNGAAAGSQFPVPREKFSPGASQGQNVASDRRTGVHTRGSRGLGWRPPNRYARRLWVIVGIPGDVPRFTENGRQAQAQANRPARINGIASSRYARDPANSV